MASDFQMKHCVGFIATMRRNSWLREELKPQNWQALVRGRTLCPVLLHGFDFNPGSNHMN